MTELDDKLRDVLEHARRSTTYYAGRLPPGSEPLPGNPREVLARLPILTRQEVQRERARLRSLTGDTHAWRAVRTTGTTGEPVEVVLDEFARAAEATALASHIDRCLGDHGWRDCDLVHVVLHPGAMSRAMPSPWSARARVVKWNLLQAWQAGQSQFLTSLAHLHGKIITTMPSVAELLARRLLEGNAAGQVQPLLILLSGEAPEPHTRSLTTQAFRCPVTTLYTLAEAGVVGVECRTDSGYHVDEGGVVVEIVDDHGNALPPGQEGAVIVTPLANRAMPLLRYRTGDRGRLVPGACRCGMTAPRIELSGARRPARLLTTSGATINVVRFAKLLATLDVQQITVAQTTARAVLVSYQADHVLDHASGSLLAAALRSALGPNLDVQIERVRDAKVVGGTPLTSSSMEQFTGAPLAEPEGPSLGELARWLQSILAREGDLETAVLTGSALAPQTTTRFSDIDLVLLVNGDATDPRWLDLARSLQRRIPRLAVNVDRLAGLERRAPLLACRLIQERLEVYGRLDRSKLSWPHEDDLRAAGRVWLQTAAATLWQRLARPLPRSIDPIHEAWIAAKFGLDALRYRYLVRGERATAAAAIVERAQRDACSDTPWLTTLLDVLDVAREHRPPPLPEEATVHHYLMAALACVRFSAAGL